VERWADNSVIVSEGFETATAVKVRSAVRDGAAHAENFPQNEIGLRLYEIPAFRKFAEEIGAQFALAMTSSLGR